MYLKSRSNEKNNIKTKFTFMIFSKWPPFGIGNIFIKFCSTQQMV